MLRRVTSDEAPAGYLRGLNTKAHLLLKTKSKLDLVIFVVTFVMVSQCIASCQSKVSCIIPVVWYIYTYTYIHKQEPQDLDTEDYDEEVDTYQEIMAK